MRISYSILVLDRQRCRPLRRLRNNNNSGTNRVRAFEIDLHSSEKVPELCFSYSANSVRALVENHICRCHKIWGEFFSVLHIEKGMMAQSLALFRAKKCLVSLTPTLIVSMPELMSYIAGNLVSQDIKISVSILSMLLHRAYVSSNYTDKTVIVSHIKAYHTNFLQLHLLSYLWTVSTFFSL